MHLACLRVQVPAASVLETLAALEWDDDDTDADGGEAHMDEPEDLDQPRARAARAAVTCALAGEEASLPMAHFVALVRALA